MKDLSFYEQAGIVIPGALGLFGLLALHPELRPLFADGGLTIGGLGLFLLIAYAAGHLIASVGNVFEGAVWWTVGGMPSMWVRRRWPRLLNDSEAEALSKKLRSRLGCTVADVRDLPSDEWRSRFHLVYRDVLSSGAGGRVEVFNGNYGLSRGLAVAAAGLALIVAIQRPSDWQTISGAGAATAAVFTFRMIRFGKHFAREVVCRFILLPDTR